MIRPRLRLYFIVFVGVFLLGAAGLKGAGLDETVALMLSAGLAWASVILIFLAFRSRSA